MPIAFISASTAVSGTNVSSVTVPRPSGVAAGDALVAFIRQATSKATVTTPDGWGFIVGGVIDPTDPGPGRVDAYGRFVGASEPADYTWVFSEAITDGATGHIVAYSGTAATNAIEDSDLLAGFASATTITAPSVDASLPGCVLVCNWSHNSGGGADSYTYPGAVAVRATTTGNAYVSTADEAIAGTGATNSRAVTINTSRNRRAGVSVLLRPPVTSTFPLPRGIDAQHRAVVAQ